MAEMTLDMYGAVGRLGNRTYYQRGGKTIARTITKPKNPKTEAQSLHRVLVKTVNKTYSMMKEICDHSFEDYDNSFDSMNKFKRVNLKYLREHVATLEESGHGQDQFYQFSPLRSLKWTPFAAIISERHMPVVSVSTEIVNSEGEFPYSNRKNELNFSTFDFDTDHFNFVLGRGGDVVAAGIIISREAMSGNWLRSNCQLAQQGRFRQ